MKKKDERRAGKKSLDASLGTHTLTEFCFIFSSSIKLCRRRHSFLFSTPREKERRRKKNKREPEYLK